MNLTHCHVFKHTLSILTTTETAEERQAREQRRRDEMERQGSVVQHP